MTNTLTVAVHGATGAQGRPVIDTLLAVGHTVRALARNPEGRVPDGAEPVSVSLDSVDELTEAYRGADAAIVVLPGGAEDSVAVAQAQNILDALAAAGVPRAVFNASGGVWNEPPGLAFLDARSVLASGLADAVATATTIGPATFYLENYSEPWVVAEIHKSGRLMQMFPPEAAAVPVSMIDIAIEMERILQDDAPPARVIVHGPGPVTGLDVIDAIRAHTRLDVEWATVDPDEYLGALADGLSPSYAENLRRLYGGGANMPPPDAPPAGTVEVTGTTTLADWVPTQQW